MTVRLPLSARPVPVLERRSAGRVVGGVAGGLADHLEVDVTKVRIAFVVLSLCAGAGVVAYGLLWVFTRMGTDTAEPSPAERRRAVGLSVMGIAGTAAMVWLLNGTAASVIGPFIVALIGAALVWREFDATGPRSLIGLAARPTSLTWVRVGGGACLLLIGLSVIIVARVDFSSLRSALLAVIVTLAGVGMLTIPLWLRTWRALNDERAERVRTQEREDIASHLHDSVLQTLALIQKRADDPTAVLGLARSQERELRKWLFDDEGKLESSLAEAISTIAGEVEDAHGVTVSPVVVGDLSLTGEDLAKYTALLGATREALVNAAKHSGETTIDVYAEVDPEQVSVFVRDRGKGFDPAQVPADRHGLARSITARVRRRGGTVDIRSEIGKGTEVRITMPHSKTETTEMA